MPHSPDIPRKQVATENCWDLSHLFDTPGDWENLFKDIEAQIPGYDRFKGRMADSFDIFIGCIEFDHGLGRNLEKIYTYAHLKNDEDKTDPEGDSLFQRAVNLYTRISDVSSFILPEIQAIPESVLAGYIEREETAHYRFYLDKIIRNIPHTRNAEAEQLLAMAGESLGAPKQIFSQLDNADLDFGTLDTEDGKGSQPLTHGNFITFLSHGDREVRKKAFHQYYGVYENHKHGMAAALSASVKKDLFLARARHFDTARQAALFKDNVPDPVYDTLIARVKAGLPPLFDYLDFRKKALGLSSLHIYDTYVPVVPDLDFNMDYETAAATCIEALAPLGPAYCATLEKGLAKTWVDRYENKGKRSGAYSSGCYDSPPYILLNYEGNTINSLFTLIHEAGHSMHSLYANQAQPYPSHDYTIFVAEVASTLNETLLGQYLLKKYDNDPRMKAYILNREIDNIRATFYRQTMFAEFETVIHNRAAQNQALTLAFFTATYRDLLSSYFGNKMVVDEALTLEFLRIPHFYSAFYVYQYATGLAAALAIAQRIRTEGQKAVADYLDFLKLGGQGFPIDQLKKAGVDMASPAPVDAAVSHFSRRVAALESLWPSI